MVEATSNPSCVNCVHLKKKIKELEEELHSLKSLQESTTTNSNEHVQEHIEEDCSEAISLETPLPYNKCDLSNSDIARYSRQILLHEINTSGQKQVQDSSVLVVGVGGLGCPAALYLTAAGVGRIGLVDYDTVDLSNLQRQVLHKEDTKDMGKVYSAERELRKLNSSVRIDCYDKSLSSENCMDIITPYNVVLDCSDNVVTRYLLNDACIKGKKILISGSALRWEGQLTVYNYDNGPCYRCLYPSPPPAATVTNCSDAGVLGAVTGVIGSLQALEAVKILSGNKTSFAGKLLLFDGFTGNFRSIRLRGRVKDCVCGYDDPTSVQLVDYELFCGSRANDKDKELNVLHRENRVTVDEYFKRNYNKLPHLLVDVRPQIEYEICSLKNSVNIPLSDIMTKKDLVYITEAMVNRKDVFVLCKRGNESQDAVLELLKYAEQLNLECKDRIKDIIGGLTAWNRVVDSQFPTY